MSVSVRNFAEREDYQGVHLGSKGDIGDMSALPPKANISERDAYVQRRGDPTVATTTLAAA